MADWGGDLDRWLAPFLARLGHKARRRMCPLYVAGLIGPGDRKSVEPMASRWAPGDYDLPRSFFIQSDPVLGAPVSVHPMWRKKASVSGREMD